jgi:3-hydroxyacyl-[acyl-carrier-protein] dehydratase
MRFVLIDRLLALEADRAVAAKTFDAGEEFLRDHFPGAPIVPGVLLTECMGQTAGWMLAAASDFSTFPLLVLVEKAKFRRPVRPGEALRVEAALQSRHDLSASVKASVAAGSDLVAEARLVFQSFEPGSLAPGLDGWAREIFRGLGGEALRGRP